ncbi:MAG: aminotransferase, partial [Thermoplasmata archaeon]
QPGALRYEVGEHSNFILVPMLLKAVQQLNNWKPERIEAYCREITREPLSILREKGFWIEDEAWRGAHLFGIRLPAGADMEKVKAHLLRHKIYVSCRGNAIRVSPNVYNTELEMRRMVRELVKKN